MSGSRVSSESLEAVFLGLGSNLGDRLGYLARGLRSLTAGGLVIERISEVVETPAIGHEDQPPFLNLVVEGCWGGTPEALMSLMGQVERDSGRERPFPNAPRTLDVDLIFFGDRILRMPDLRVPHPRWKDRSFVVQPLQNLAASFRDPETGLTVEEIGHAFTQEPVEIVEVLEGRAFRWREQENQ